jgi:capsular polysaccharide biosynthesis protein
MNRDEVIADLSTRLIRLEDITTKEKAENAAFRASVNVKLNIVAAVGAGILTMLFGVFGVLIFKVVL